MPHSFITLWESVRWALMGQSWSRKSVRMALPRVCTASSRGTMAARTVLKKASHFSMVRPGSYSFSMVS